ncbi:MAG: isochorismate synthase, partial [Anaerolineae bacterium]|nr:isochorismate synthase [Anaerolineae bacterium]
RKAERLFEDVLIDGEASPRLFGGFAFQDDFVPDNTWTIYAPAYFILPHYQLTRRGGQTWLTLNAHTAPDEDVTKTLAELREALAARAALLKTGRPLSTDHPMSPVSVRYPMAFETWAQIITDATTRIKAGELKKVVLSRVCEIRFSEWVNVDSALDFLAEKYANSYRFLFEPRPHHAFYGATPELLVKVDDARIRTMGLAGSIRRGATPDEDAVYAAQILNDPKERLEHALVVDAIKARLTPITDELHVPDMPTLYRLSNIQHLYTPIEGVLKDGSMGVLPLVELMHPTPALGGEPRDAAMRFIREAEPVPRGWYAAPIGWIDHRLNGAFGVAIRSAVSQDRRVWLYAGAGIVGDSQPQKEWDETALKFRPMLNALGIQNAV